MSPTVETLTLDVDGCAIHGIRQRDTSQTAAPRLLCLHGWLDNANSFVPMMPYLPGFDLVAIDLPGHGHSEWIGPNYTLHEMCYRVTRVIEALGWKRCHIVGHSMGGGVGCMLAVANPKVVQSLTLIDSSGAVSEPADQLPERMAKALRDRLNLARFSSRLLRSKQEAVDSRLAANKMKTASARLISDRQLEKVEGGYRWRFDPRWRLPSNQYQTEEQARAILATIDCPTLAIIAETGYLVKRENTIPRLRCLANRTKVELPGHHHVHMDTPEPVAIAINRFLGVAPAVDG